MHLTYHPLCEMFPPMSPDEFDALVLSIGTRGQREPIVAIGNEILDGKHRHMACLKLGIPPRVRQYDPVTDGASQAQYVADHILSRRNLTTSQRATAAVEIERALAAERQAAGGKPSGRDRTRAARAAGVGDGTAAKAKRLAAESPELFAKVKAGEVTLEAALRAVAVPDDVRKLSIDRVAAVFGDAFADRIRHGGLLPGPHLREFGLLSRDDQEAVMPMVEAGWSPLLAVKIAREHFVLDDRVGELLCCAEWNGGTATVACGGYRITIQKQPA